MTLVFLINYPSQGAKKIQETITHEFFFVGDFARGLGGSGRQAAHLCFIPASCARQAGCVCTIESLFTIAGGEDVY